MVLKDIQLRYVSQFCCVCYIVSLLYFRFQPIKRQCEIIQYIDPLHLCETPNDPSHVNDCSLSFRAIRSISDQFVIAHLLGYVVKSILFPHRQALWTLSITFELVERILSPFIPWFQECWWDSLIVDVLVCNAVGIEVGIIFSTPLADYVADNQRRIYFITFCILMTDLNGFLLRSNFNLRVTSPIHISRLLLLLLLFLPLRSCLISKRPCTYTITIIISVIIVETLVSL